MGALPPSQHDPHHVTTLCEERSASCYYISNVSYHCPNVALHLVNIRELFVREFDIYRRNLLYMSFKSRLSGNQGTKLPLLGDFLNEERH